MGFFIRDEPGGLDGIHQQLQFGQFEFPFAQVVGAVPSAIGTDDVQTEVPQFVKIAVQGLPVRIDPVFLEPFCNLLQGETVVIIGFLLENLFQVQHLLFLVDPFGHGSFPPWTFFFYDTFSGKKREQKKKKRVRPLKKTVYIFGKQRIL